MTPSKKPTKSVRRVVGAFITALRMTLRGENVDTLLLDKRYPALTAWMAQTVTLIDAVKLASASNAVDLAQSLHIDKRDITIATMLDTIRYHSAHEYPYILKNQSVYASMGIQSLNLNDRYLILSLVRWENLPTSIAKSIEQLRDHLDQLPLDDFKKTAR